jgi:adenosine kinase
MNILCTGSIAYDYLMTFPGIFREHILADRLETISLSFLVDSMVRQRGGTAANIAYTLAMLGARPRIMATAGIDFPEYREWLESKGIDTSLIKIIPEKFTASFFANTDLANAQISSFYTGAMAHASELSLYGITGEKPDLVVISPNDPAAMRRLCIECQELGIDYVYDPSQQLVRMAQEDIRSGVEGAMCLFANEYEFELLQKHTGMTKAKILTCVKFLVVTSGELGAKVYVGKDSYPIPVVIPRNIADPTGVGDAFRGGFLTGYRLGLDWDTCGRMGALAATYCLEQHGTQNHTYAPEEFIARYQENFGNAQNLEPLIPKAVS